MGCFKLEGQTLVKKKVCILLFSLNHCSVATALVNVCLYASACVNISMLGSLKMSFPSSHRMLIDTLFEHGLYSCSLHIGLQQLK